MTYRWYLTSLVVNAGRRAFQKVLLGLEMG
jgi:hypothetical protein